MTLPVLSCAIGDYVVSTCPTYYPGKVGIVKSIRPSENKDDFPNGFDVTVGLLDVPGLCAFDTADLKLAGGNIGDPERSRGLRICDRDAASDAAQELRGPTRESGNVYALNPSGYLMVAVERYRDTGELLPGVEIVPKSQGGNPCA